MLCVRNVQSPLTASASALLLQTQHWQELITRVPAHATQTMAPHRSYKQGIGVHYPARKEAVTQAEQNVTQEALSATHELLKRLTAGASHR